jgi:nitrite reductase/ring-hydroxylating ferredoxin subunit
LRSASRSKFTDGAMLQGHFKDEPILLARREDAYFAIGATCTHYSGPLADGIMVGDTVREPTQWISDPPRPKST